MLAAERRYERAADQVVRCVNCEISECLLTADIIINEQKDGLFSVIT